MFRQDPQSIARGSGRLFDALDLTEKNMRNLTSAELATVSGGKKSKVTPVGPKKKTLPVQAGHGNATAIAASNKPKAPKTAE